MRLIPAILLLVAAHAFADTEVIDRSGKWDVNGPLHANQSVLEFTTDEGTWMALDVHPDGDRIVFDMLGDLYILPIGGGQATRLTKGAAYDLQPQFSPDGSKVLFSSDRGGNWNVWVAGFDGEKLSDIKVLSEQTSNGVDDGVWMAGGEWILARKRVTDISSIGVAELWMYHKNGGAGVQLVADKGEVQGIAPSPDGRYVYYGASGGFSYNTNVHDNIWSVIRYDRETGEKRTVAGGNGSASVPTLSPDGKTLAFVRRIGTASALWLHDLADGSERQIWDGLDRDEIAGFAANGVYPSFDWLPDGKSLIVWAAGKINQIAVNNGRVADIPFQVDVSLRYHQPLRSKRDPAPETLQANIIRWPVISPDGSTLVFNALGHLYYKRLPDGTPQRLTSAGEFEFAPAFSPDGSRMAFTTWSDTTGGALKTIAMRRGRPGASTTVYRSGSQLANPAYSADGKQILVVAGSGANLRGEDLGDEQRHDILLLSASGRGDAQLITSTTNRGAQMRITRPTFSRSGDRIWYIDNEEMAGERGERKPGRAVLYSIKLDSTDRKLHMGLRYAQEIIVSPDETHVAFTELHNAYVAPLPKLGAIVDFNPTSAAFPFQRLSNDGGEWVAWSHDSKQLSWGFGRKVYRASTSDLTFAPKVEPRDAGDDGISVVSVSVLKDGKYSYGDTSYELPGLKSVLEPEWRDAAQARVDVTVSDGAPWSAWSAFNEWLTESKIAVKQITKKDEDKEAKKEKPFEPEQFEIDLTVPRAKPDGTLVLSGARIITMEGDEIIENGVIVVEDNRIIAVGSVEDVAIPAGAKTIDVSGKTVMPGFVDVHAHLGYAVLDVNPQKDWQYYVNLAYGVTTVHDPSASTHIIFGQSEMVSAGVMVGPRIFSTGFILYGSDIQDKAEISSYADALSHVRRLKNLGAFSVKSYEQPRRDQRQWIIRAAAAENMLVVPEGGGDYAKNMGMIIDGHSGIEHAMSVANTYNDTVTLYVKTRAGYTATLLVAYGDLSGENWFYQHYEAWKNDKLQSFHPPRLIDARARRRSMAADDDYNHMNVARHQKKIDDAGGLITLGAHGQLQGLGTHWELWALTQGGIEPHDALRIATINGAEYLGMDKHLGSITAGKLADLVVLDENPLEKIENSDSVNMTVIDGVVYDAASMNQLWPKQVERGKFLFQ